MSQYSDLASEFDVDKNGITPDKVVFTNSNEETWWRCQEGHEFKRSAWYRINRISECPVCSRSIVVKGENDFQKAHPEIIEIWDYEANGRAPDDISDKNNGKYASKCEKDVWWSCKVCKSKYLMNPKRKIYFQRRHMK